MVEPTTFGHDQTVVLVKYHPQRRGPHQRWTPTAASVDVSTQMCPTLTAQLTWVDGLTAPRPRRHAAHTTQLLDQGV